MQGNCHNAHLTLYSGVAPANLAGFPVVILIDQRVISLKILMLELMARILAPIFCDQIVAADDIPPSDSSPAPCTSGLI